MTRPERRRSRTQGIQKRVPEQDIEDCMVILTYLQATSAADYGQKAAAQEQLKMFRAETQEKKFPPQSKTVIKPWLTPEQVRHGNHAGSEVVDVA